MCALVIMSVTTVPLLGVLLKLWEQAKIHASFVRLTGTVSSGHDSRQNHKMTVLMTRCCWNFLVLSMPACALVSLWVAPYLFLSSAPEWL